MGLMDENGLILLAPIQCTSASLYRGFLSAVVFNLLKRALFATARGISTHQVVRCLVG